ncbi:MAG: M14 family zinc carboxypeptidase, partial [Verrucomicrobiota bacterium]
MNDLSVITAEFGDLSRWQKRTPFWIDQPDLGIPFLRSLKTATVHVIGKSAGGREIVAVEMGEKEPLDATTDNLSSSLASVQAPPDPTAVFPPSFYGKTRRRKPVLAIQGGIHGGELTGTVAMMNLCKIVEDGEDLRGKKWPALQE